MGENENSAFHDFEILDTRRTPYGFEYGNIVKHINFVEHKIMKTNCSGILRKMGTGKS